MAFENSAGINVHNHYGPRDTGNSVGVERSTDSIHQLSVDISVEQLLDPYVPPVVLQQGVRVLRALVHVDEGFAGLTDVSVGKEGDETNNGITILGTQITQPGTYDITSVPNGEWAVSSPRGLTTSQKVGVVHTGTPTAGKGTILVEYVYKNRKEPTA